jgi:hypothetical protein
METVQLQALRLEFGDKFDVTYSRTQSYVKGLIAKPWWINKRALIVGEGGIDMMTQHCMLFQFEFQDRIIGYQEYTKHLSYLYGSTISHNTKKVPLEDALGREARSVSASSADTYSEELVHEWGEEYPEWLNEQMADYLLSHIKMGAAEAAEIHNISEEQAWKEYRRIKEKARRFAIKNNA